MDGEDQTVFILVNCVDDKIDETIKQLQKIRDVSEINLTKGPYDMILTIKPKSTIDLKHTLNQKIRRLDSIKYTLTLRAMETQS